MNKLLFFVFMVCAASTLAQKAPIKFGDIPMEDLTMKIYDKDSSAAAVVLADFGETSMAYVSDKGFLLTFERLTRIKILKREGLEWGNFTIPLYHRAGNDERVAGLKATTYNLEDGKIVQTKFKSDAIFREKYDEDINLVKVTLPNVKEGSIVEISYKITSDFLFNLQDWTFQSTIPTRWSEYQVRIPEYFKYEKYVQGYISMEVSESTSAPSSMTITFRDDDVEKMGDSKLSTEKIDFQENRFRWVAKDVPAFKDEPFITTYKDYVSKINFELSFTNVPGNATKNYMGSWADINKTYSEDENFTGEITGNGYLKKTVEEITKNTTSAEEKISIIDQYIKQNIQWNGETRKYSNTQLKKIFEDKKGNSSEINLLMASMLEKADIQVYPVLISTRDHGFLQEAIPVSSQFNNVICLIKIGERDILLDGTEKLLPTGFLPERCLNGKGLVIAKSGYAWVNLSAPSKSKTTTNIEMTLDEKGDFLGKIILERTGYFAQRNRKEYFTKGESNYVKDFTSNRAWEITKSNFENNTQLLAPFKEVHELKVHDFSTVNGDMIYFNPLFGLHLEANPFKSEKREYPVDFGSPFDLVHFVKILIPEGYQIEELPKSKAVALPNNMGKFLYNVSGSGNSIMLTSSLQINRSLYTKDEYEALRELFAQKVAKQAEQIVLKKK